MKSGVGENGSAGAESKMLGEQAMWNVNAIARRWGISKRGVWRGVNRGDLVQPIKLGRSARWFLSDVVAAEERFCRNRGDAGNSDFAND
jgi:predicted DNA-binding transcriptional regulator AlpA